MIRVMFPEMHNRVSLSLAHAIKDYGVLLLPDPSFKELIKYGHKWTQEQINEILKLENIFSISYEEFLAAPPDIMISSCYENEQDIYNLYDNMGTNKKPVIIHYNGNMLTPLQWGRVEHMFTTDHSMYVKAVSEKVNTIMYYPYIDYDNLPYSGKSDVMKIGTYIMSYPKVFPEDFAEYNSIKNLSSKNIPDLEYTSFDGVPFEECKQSMIDSMATYHVKWHEGYGYTIIESLAIGRPLILKREYTKNRNLSNWCLENENCIMYDNQYDCIEKIKELVYNKDYRYLLQENSSRIIREHIINDEQSEKLKRFIEGVL